MVLKTNNIAIIIRNIFVIKWLHNSNTRGIILKKIINEKSNLIRHLLIFCHDNGEGYNRYCHAK